MPVKKTNYKYWELPSWSNDIIYVKQTLWENGKNKIILEDGENLYKIVRPRREKWSDVKEGMNIMVTKDLLMAKKATITIIGTLEYLNPDFTYH